MNRSELVNQIRLKESFLCIGLDAELTQLPAHLLDFSDPVFEFNRQIIDATKNYCVAYKPNLAFYEALGKKGWESLERTVDYIPKTHFTIADAKRGDIGNTSRLYAKAFFETLNFDAVTVAPYMGEDSVKPFLEFKDKWAIVLALTSNKGAQDFQIPGDLYKHILRKAQTWGTPENLMFVVGATQADKLKEIRELVPDHFLLVPGVGAQGGDLTEVAGSALNKDVGLLINASRSIIYAGKEMDFAEKAATESISMQRLMKIAMTTKS